MSHSSRKAAGFWFEIHEKFKVAGIGWTGECQCYSENFPMFFRGSWDGIMWTKCHVFTNSEKSRKF